MAISHICKKTNACITSSVPIFDHMIRSISHGLKSNKMLLNKSCELVTDNVKKNTEGVVSSMDAILLYLGSCRTISDMNYESKMWLNGLAKHSGQVPIWMLKIYDLWRYSWSTKDGFVDKRLSNKNSIHRREVVYYLTNHPFKRLEIQDSGSNCSKAKRKQLDVLNKRILIVASLYKNCISQPSYDNKLKNILDLLILTHSLQKALPNTPVKRTAHLTSVTSPAECADTKLKYMNSMIDTNKVKTINHHIVNATPKIKKIHYDKKINKVNPCIKIRKHFNEDGTIAIPGLFIKLSFDPEPLAVVTTSSEFDTTRGLCCMIKMDGSVLPTVEFWKSNGGTIPAFLEAFNSDLWTNARNIGKITNACIFCGRPLSCKFSLEHGYGATCAKNWGISADIVAGNNVFISGNSSCISGAACITDIDLNHTTSKVMTSAEIERLIARFG